MVTVGQQWLWQEGLPARILDQLETDGGWLTVPGLACDLDATPAAVRRALFRLRGKSLVESRSVDVRGWVDLYSGRERVQRRQEWRLA